MKKTISILLSLLMLCGAFSPLSAYANTTENVSLGRGAYYYLGSSIYIDKKPTSSNTKVVQIIENSYDWYIKAVGNGSATVKVTEDYSSTTYNVKVSKPVLSCSNKSVTADINDYYYELDDEALFVLNYTGFNGLKITSSNTAVATASLTAKTLNDYNSYYYDDDYGITEYPVNVKMKKRGSTTFTVSDNYGNKLSLSLTVTDDEADEELQERMNDKTEADDLYYGDKSLYGKTVSAAKVTLHYGKKKYKTKSDGNGKFKFSKLPVKKVGTKFQIYVEKGNADTVIKGKVLNNEPYYWHYYLYRNQTTLRGYVKNVHKGDVIIAKIGKKTYKKKVKKDKKKLKYSFKVKKAKYGTKIKFIIKNKYNQKLTSYSDIVYYSKKIKRGMTMAQAKCVPGWTNPGEKSHYDTGTYWWYDDDGDGYASDSYLYFNSRNRLESWYFTS